MPSESPTIQNAINIAEDTDTILVAPGTYYENLNIYGKYLTIVSHYFTTGDTSVISETIIDGGASGTVVSFSYGEDSTMTLSRFTIQNGFAENGGGISITDGTRPKLSHLIIKNNVVSQN